MRECSLVGTARLTASIFSRWQRFEIADHARFEFRGDCGGAFGVRVHDANQFHASISDHTRTWLRPKSPTPTTATRMGFSVTISFSAA